MRCRECKQAGGCYVIIVGSAVEQGLGLKGHRDPIRQHREVMTAAESVLMAASPGTAGSGEAAGKGLN